MGHLRRRLRWTIGFYMYWTFNLWGFFRVKISENIDISCIERRTTVLFQRGGVLRWLCKHILLTFGHEHQPLKFNFYLSLVWILAWFVSPKIFKTYMYNFVYTIWKALCFSMSLLELPFPMFHSKENEWEFHICTEVNSVRYSWWYF